METSTNKYSAYLVQAIITAFVTLLGVFVLYKTVLNSNQYPTRTFSVEGIAKETEVPQIVSTTYSIQENGATQKEAQDKGNAKQKQAEDILSSLGFKKEDIKTTGYYVNEDFDFTQGGRTSRGYVINISTEIKANDVEKVNKAIDQLTALGINIGGVSYAMDTKNQQVQEKVRKAAIEDAKEKASAIAQAAGFRIGEIVSINEWTDNGLNGQQPYYAADAKGGAMSSAPTEIQPGSSQSTLHVSITYAIK